MTDHHRFPSDDPAPSRRDVFRGGAAMLASLTAGATLASAFPFRVHAAEELLSGPPVPGPGGPPTSAAALATLNDHTRRILHWVEPAPGDWVRPRDGVDYNVVVVGGGQSGSGISYTLARKGIGKVLTIDQAAPGQVGVFRTHARMRQLNSGKTLTGPARDNVGIGFRAWYETLHGPAAFDALERVPRLVWADYIDWFRDITGTKLRYRTSLRDIEPVGDLLRLHLTTDGAPGTVTTRKLVLATGTLGGGGPNVPDFLEKLPSRVWAHTASELPPEKLRGKIVAVIGGGGSAFNGAATALEAGAAEVHLFIRKSYVNYSRRPSSEAEPDLARPDAPHRYNGPPGLSGWLPDAVLWRYQLLRNNPRTVNGTPVTLDELRLTVGSDRFYIHLNSALSDVAVGPDGKVFARASGETFHFDFIIAGTGYRVDVAARPELARFHRDISLWGDRYQPEAGEENPTANYFPYLGAGFEFQPKQGVDAPYLKNIHFYNPAGRLSFNAGVSDIRGAQFHPVLVDAIARDLLIADIDPDVTKRAYAAPPPPPPDPGLYQRAVYPRAVR